MRRLDLTHPLQDLVGPRLLGMAEDVEASQPAAEGDADQQEDEDSPEKQVVLAGRFRLVIKRVKVISHAAWIVR